MTPEVKKIIQSKKIKVTIGVILILAVFSVIFQAGVYLGFHKASFLYNSGDNFYRAFGEENNETNRVGFKDEFSGGHGAIGKIVKIALPTLVVVGPDNIEKVVLTDGKTSVHSLRNIASTTELKVDDYITVLGTPNDQGQVMARFIRIMPTPQTIMSPLRVPRASTKLSTSSINGIE